MADGGVALDSTGVEGRDQAMWDDHEKETPDTPRDTDDPLGQI